ncbi:GLUG motif-containing protein [Natrinema limicola]|uniref:Periplasmic copper-binding protein n=1 Tax=Natrinema limicola JCM 13563 TaxID=1230457 RepID=M0BWM7_9EURY|nr:GLUG motif-containing protein [Natrinema limicola]ELZ15375.1 periplasmic copper-binding protein [Natrinema limicola JCM 13563]
MTDDSRRRTDNGAISRRTALLGLLGGVAGSIVGYDRLLGAGEPAFALTDLGLTANDVMIDTACGRVSDVSVSGDSEVDLEYENLPSTLTDGFELTLEANPHVANREDHAGWSEPHDTPGNIVPANDLAGEGTEANPYKITTDQELQAVAEELDAHYELATNIDASETHQWNGGAGFNPIGNESNPFTGAFNGNGYEICGITINRSNEDYVGVFGVIDGVLENVFVTHVDITGLGEVGALVGATGVGNMDGAEGIGAHARGSVTGQYSVGGLVGYNHDFRPVENSSAAVDVGAKKFDDNEGEEFVGGLVGYNSGDVIDSHSTGTVEGPNDVGGLVGHNFESGQVINSYATGKAIADHTVGGLVGFSEGDVSGSHAKGDVTANAVHPDDEYSAAGGLVGYNSGAAGVGTISNSYVTGDAAIVGESVVGGLVGLNYEGDGTVGTISDSHVTTGVTVEGLDPDESVVGGLVGANGDGGVITESSAECGVSGKRLIGGLVGANLAAGTGLLGLGGDDRGVIKKSFATGSVEGGDEVGGLVGANGGLVEDAYARGDVNGGERIGGFVGINLAEESFLGIIGGNQEGEIRRVYSTGGVMGDNTVGGLAGQNEDGSLLGVTRDDGILEDSYWDTESTGQNDGIGDATDDEIIEGLTTDEMQGADAETNMDALDFIDVWTTVENPDDYPELVNTRFSGPSDVTDDYEQLEESGDPIGFDAIFENEPISDLPGNPPHDVATVSLTSLVGEDVSLTLENHKAIDGGTDDGTAYRQFEPYRAVERKTKIDFKLVLKHADEDIKATAETTESATVHVSGGADR